MKQPRRSIKVGHPSVGSFGHLADMLIMQELGVKVTAARFTLGEGKPTLMQMDHALKPHDSAKWR